MTFLKKLFLVLINRPSGKALSESKIWTDEELVSEITKSNNTLLFGTLYDRYSTKVYNKCYGFAKNQDEAEDLTQDVFLKLFTKLHSFKGKAKFSTWLYSITYNFCANYVTRVKAKKMGDATESIDDHDYYLSTVEDIEEEDLFELQASRLKIALENIDPEEKSLLLLKYQDDVSIKELQSVLKIGESAVKMRLKRARLVVADKYNNLVDDD